MARQMRMLIAATTLSVACAVGAAQTADQPGAVNSTVQQQQAAPIERGYSNQNTYAAGQMPQQLTIAQASIAPGQDVAPAAGEAQAIPIEGVYLRVGPQSSVKEVSSDAQKLELRVERGVANVNVHKPAKDTLILVDLPGGQTQILKDGLYTFNAETNTARVLKGEALAFPTGTAENAKPVKVKEDNKVVYNGASLHAQGFVPYEASVDLLPGPAGEPGPGGAAGPYYGPYGYGFYPYYAYGPWGWGYPYYPYGYGFYPFGAGVGFGYYGGFRGGYGGGFHGGGGGFHGGGRGR